MSGTEIDIEPGARFGERAFTLIELVVVMLILSIIMGITIPTFFSAKKNAKRDELISAARSFSSAIEAYKLDHGGRAPQINTPDWPLANVLQGPLNNTPGLPDSKRRYLKAEMPDSIASGVVPFGTTAGSGSYIQYTVAPNLNDYSLVVSVDTKQCSIGMAVPSVPACA